MELIKKLTVGRTAARRYKVTVKSLSSIVMGTGECSFETYTVQTTEAEV